PRYGQLQGKDLNHERNCSSSGRPMRQPNWFQVLGGTLSQRRLARGAWTLRIGQPATWTHGRGRYNFSALTMPQCGERPHRTFKESDEHRKNGSPKIEAWKYDDAPSLLPLPRRATTQTGSAWIRPDPPDEMSPTLQREPRHCVQPHRLKTWVHKISFRL
ncbi:hypothetical protein THAOC_24354, partial [Thalassiosira oceanica]